MRLLLGLLGLFGYALATVQAAHAVPTVSSCVGDYGAIVDILGSSDDPEHAELVADFSARSSALASAGARAGQFGNASQAGIAAVVAPVSARLRAGTDTAEALSERVGACMSAYPNETVATAPVATPKPAPAPRPAPQSAPRPAPQVAAASQSISVVSCAAHYNAAGFILMMNNQPEQSARYVEKVGALNRGSVAAGQGEIFKLAEPEAERYIQAYSEPGFDIQGFSDRLDTCDRLYPNGVVSRTGTARSSTPAPAPRPAPSRPDVTSCAAHFAAFGAMMSSIEDKPQRVGPAYLKAAQTMGQTAGAAGVPVDGARYSREAERLLKGVGDGSVPINTFEAALDVCDRAYPEGYYR